MTGGSGLAPGLLAGRRVLVTGGGTGLGRAMGERFLELGADLAICGRRADVLEGTAAKFGARHGRPVATAVCDVRDAAAVEAMLDAVGPLDVLVNNAAANFLARTHLLSARALDAVLGTTLHGAAYAMIGCGRRWIGSGRGGVVLSVLTLSALQGGAFTAPSAMAKAGLLAMTRSLAVEWGGGTGHAWSPSRRAPSRRRRRPRASAPIQRATPRAACRSAAPARTGSWRTSRPFSCPTWRRTSPANASSWTAGGACSAALAPGRRRCLAGARRSGRGSARGRRRAREDGAWRGRS
jgi:NAD(P)-dependent dehydrogenase (short-subunit alcohol dehydrogenase family)